MRGRLRIAAAAAAGLTAVAGLVAGGTALAASRPAPAAPLPALVNCLGKPVVQPRQYTLACADGNAYLSGLRWTSWRGVAFGQGTEYVNDCVPDCVGGRFYHYPVLITLWRAQARPGHPSQRYFSRLTLIHTGSLHIRGGRLPRTQTFPLGSVAG